MIAATQPTTTWDTSSNGAPNVVGSAGDIVREGGSLDVDSQLKAEAPIALASTSYSKQEAVPVRERPGDDCNGGHQRKERYCRIHPIDDARPATADQPAPNPRADGGSLRMNLTIVHPFAEASIPFPSLSLARATWIPPQLYMVVICDEYAIFRKSNPAAEAPCVPIGKDSRIST